MRLGLVFIYPIGVGDVICNIIYALSLIDDEIGDAGGFPRVLIIANKKKPRELSTEDKDSASDLRYLPSAYFTLTKWRVIGT